MDQDANCLLQAYRSYRTHERELSPRTIELFSRYIGEFLRASHNIDADGVRAWLMTLGHNSAQTVKGKLTAIKSFAQWLFKAQLLSELEKGRILEIKGPRVPRRLPLVLSPEQVAQLIETQAPPPPKNGIHPLRWMNRELRDTAFIEVGYATGLRVAELCSLDLQVCAELTQALKEGLLQFPVIGKGNKEAIVRAGRKALEALEAYLNVRPLFAHPRTGCLHPTALFVGIRYGARLTTTEARKLMKRRGGRCNLPAVHPHTLRHCLASHLNKDGAGLPAIQKVLRHDSIGSTMLYVHLADQEVTEAFRRHFPRA